MISRKYGQDPLKIQGVDPEQTNGRQTQIIVRYRVNVGLLRANVKLTQT